MHGIFTASCGTLFVTEYEFYTCQTRKHLPLQVASLGNFNTGIGSRQRNFNGSFIDGRSDTQIAIFGVISSLQAISVPSLLCVSFWLISVPKLWRMIIHRCMCKGHRGHQIVLDSKPSWLTMNQLDIVLPAMFKQERKNPIRDQIYEQNFSQWCDTRHRWGGRCLMRICTIDHCHAAFIHTFNSITLRSDLVHMVKNLKIAYGRSWKWRRRCWIRNGEEVGVYWSTSSGWIDMW